MRVFSSLENAWEASASELQQTSWKPEIIEAFLTFRKNIHEEHIQAELQRENVTVLTKKSLEYPELLKYIFDPPLCLFLRGNLENMSLPLAVVGTRKCTSYGIKATEDIVKKLSLSGITIVSGLAMGIDGIAHKTTLAHKGKTIAVLGSGVDNRSITPTMHVSLAQRILDSGGCLLSEYPPGTQATRYSFPMRNRIIAGMTLGTLVIEAPEKSGSLITAQCALESGREIFSLPQNIYSPTSQGPNKLIQSGAHCITKAEDILNILNIPLPTTKKVSTENTLSESPLEKKILSCLALQARHIDEITKEVSQPSKDILSTLTIMEMRGRIRNLGGMTYSLLS